MLTLARGTSFWLGVLGLAVVQGLAASACGSDDETGSTTPTGTGASGGSGAAGGSGATGGQAGAGGTAGGGPVECGDGPCGATEDCSSCPADCGPCATGSTYYVSLSGSDENPGTIEAPFLTIQKGADALAPGDALYLRGGTYVDHAWFSTSGTDAAPIVVTGYPGEEVILDGQDYTYPEGEGSAFLTFAGDWYFAGNITATKAYDMGIVSTGANNVLHNFFSHHNWGSGIILTGDYDVAEHCRVWSNSMNNENGQMPISWGTGISCARYPDHCTIRHTTSWENWGEGISTFETMHATIEDCVSYDNMQNYYISDTQYSVLQRSIAYCSPDNPHAQYFSSQNGILVGDEKGVPVPLPDGPREASRDNRIVNNLVVGCCRNLAASQAVSTNNLYAHNTFVGAVASCSEPVNVLLYEGACENARLANNLVLQQDANPIALVDTGCMVLDHNLWSKLPSQAVAQGPGDVVADPMLLMTGSTAAGELEPDYFRITAGSPAIDAADPSVPVSDDFFGTARGAAPDLGAHEL